MNFVSNFSAIGTAFFCVKLAGSQSFHQRKDFSRKEITLEQLVLMGISDAKSMIRTVNKRIVSTFMVLLDDSLFYTLVPKIQPVIWAVNDAVAYCMNHRMIRYD